MTMEQNEEISTNTTKQISENIYHKYLALGRFFFQVGSDYVKTMWKRTIWPPKASIQALAMLEHLHKAMWKSTALNNYCNLVPLYQQMPIHIITYEYISTNMLKYNKIWMHINKYQQISIHINRYRYISPNIFKYKQIWMHINKYHCISTNIHKYQYIYLEISTSINKCQQI